MIAAKRIMGSAIMKMGIVPCVSVTRVEKSMIRHIPEAKILSPVWSLCFAWATA